MNNLTESDNNPFNIGATDEIEAVAEELENIAEENALEQE